MSPYLRAELLILAVFVFLVVFRAVNRGKLRVQFSLIWLTVAAAMVAAAAVPRAVKWLSNALHVAEVTNFIYLVGILALMAIGFKQSEILSQHSEQVKRLTQELSLLKKQLREQEQNETDKNT